MIFVRQFVHLTTYFFTATQFNHVLSESFITDEPVVNTEEISLLAFLFVRIRDEVLVISLLLPVAVPVGSPFLNVMIGNRKEVKSVLDESLVPFHSISQEVLACAVDDADHTTDILCTVLWVPHRAVHTIRCFQLL